MSYDVSESCYQVSDKGMLLLTVKARKSDFKHSDFFTNLATDIITEMTAGYFKKT
jgi:hypothetical protein